MPNDTTTAPAVTSLANLRNPEPAEARMPTVRTGMMDLQGFELMQRVAKALAASTLVPQQYQGNLPNCLIALEMAQRIGASPLMVTQNLYVVHGRPGWSAKFLIATFNQCGRFDAIRYEWQKAPGSEDWGCRAYSKERATGEKIIGPLITMALAKKEGWSEKSGSKWKTIPELMLMYRAAAWMINTHAPEISMGLNSAEEINDVYDATRGAAGEYEVTTDGLRGELPPPNTAQGGNGDEPMTRERAAAQLALCTDSTQIDLVLDSITDLPAADQDYIREEAEKMLAKLAGAKAVAK